MKRNVILFVILLFCVLKAYAQCDSLPDVVITAELGFRNYLDLIPIGQESSYGFQSRDEFDVAMLGKPYQILTLGSEFFRDSTLLNKNCLVSTGNWLFPVLVNGEYRVFITVAEINGLKEVVGLGAASLAKEVGIFEMDHPSTKDRGSILRVYQLKSDFVLFSSDSSPSNVFAYPLFSATNVINVKDRTLTLYPLVDALSLIKKMMDLNEIY